MHTLHRELRQCQRRLGTPAERPGDLEYALKLAHEINNVVTGMYFSAATNESTESLTFAGVVKQLLSA